MNDVEIVKYENVYERLKIIKNKIEILNTNIEQLDKMLQKNINIDNTGLNNKEINKIENVLEDISQEVDNAIVSINSKLIS